MRIIGVKVRFFAETINRKTRPIQHYFVLSYQKNRNTLLDGGALLAHRLLMDCKHKKNLPYRYVKKISLMEVYESIYKVLNYP